jgi:hypothetical protein
MTGKRRREDGCPAPEPVRRDSVLRGSEGRLWRPFKRQEVSRYMLAAERYDLAGRIGARQDRTGQKNGPLGHVALDVLRQLLRLIDYRTGQLDPSINGLAARIGRSAAAVVAALARLRDHGFLDWLRRYEPTGNTGKGPRVQQTTNAYRLHLPPRAERLLPAAAPAPADHVHRATALAAEAKAMIDGLPLWEQGTAASGFRDPSGIGSALDKLGAAIARRAGQECDSKQQQESPSHIYLSKERPA